MQLTSHQSGLKSVSAVCRHVHTLIVPTLESTLAASQASLSAAEVGPQQLAEVEQHFEAETAAGDQGAPAQRQGSGSQVQLERVLWGVDVDDLLQRLTTGASDYDPSQRIRCGTAPQQTCLGKSAGRAAGCARGTHSAASEIVRFVPALSRHAAAVTCSHLFLRHVNAEVRCSCLAMPSAWPAGTASLVLRIFEFAVDCSVSSNHSAQTLSAPRVSTKAQAPHICRPRPPSSAFLHLAMINASKVQHSCCVKACHHACSGLPPADSLFTDSEDEEEQPAQPACSPSASRLISTCEPNGRRRSMAASRQRLQTGTSVRSSKAPRHLPGLGSLKLAQKNRHSEVPAKLQPLEHRPALVQTQPVMHAAGQVSPPPSRKASPQLVLMTWCSDRRCERLPGK